MSDPRTDLPPVTSPNFLEKLRETVQTYLGNRGNALDRGVTLRDLAESGFATLRPNFNKGSGSPIGGPGSLIVDGIVYEPDLTPPPTPSGFVATAAISNLLVECDPQTYTQGHGHAKSRLYGATWTSGALPVFTDAVVITEFSGTVASHATNPATTWHLWLTWVSVDGVESTDAAGGTNGVVTRTGEDVALLLEALTGEIKESQLYADLGARIDLIDTPTTGLQAQLAAANASIAAINATLADIASTPAYNPATTYAMDDMVAYDGALYQAKSTTTGNLPTNTTYWTKVGDYASIGDAVAGHAVILSDHETRIDTAESGLTAQASDITALQSSVTTLSGAKADASALTALATRVTSAEGVNTSQASSLTTLTSSLSTTNTNVTAAQTTANTAVTNAATAQTAANTANTAIADIASDAKLTPVEKSAVRNEWNVIAAEKAGNNTQATTFGITTENTTYNTTFQTLATYLNNGTTWSAGIPSWIADASLSTTTTIVGATFRTNFAAYYAARTALLNAIALKAKTLADAAQTQANTATTNAATAQTTANTAVTNAAAVATRTTALESSVNHATTGLATKAAITYVDTAKADAISASATASQTLVSSIQVGGVNLAINSSAASAFPSLGAGVTVTTVTGAALPSGKTGSVVRIQNVSGSTVRVSNCIRALGVYSIGFWHRLIAGSGVITLDVCDLAAGGTTSSAAWQKHTKEAFNVTTYSAATYNFIDINIPVGTTIEIYQFKVEKGTKATDWSPAPEDVDASISTVSAAVQTEATTRATQTGDLYAQYTVKLDVGGKVSGYGLASTGPTGTGSTFAIRADKFYISPPSGSAVTTDIIPFAVQATATTINGVAVPAGVYINDAYIKNGTITTAKIGDAQIDNAKIANVSAAKLTAGSIGVGSYISSTVYTAGSAGWRINADGTAEFSGVVVRGTVYATAGQIGGNTIDATGVQSPGYTAGSTGWRLDTSGLVRAFASSGSRVLDLAATGSASVLKIGTVLDLKANGSGTFGGTLDVKSATSGARMEIKNNVIKVFDDSGVLRVQLGDLTV